MEQRLSKLRAALVKADLPALLISAPSNRRYLSGFTGSYGHLLITLDQAFLLTDSRYVIQASQEAPNYSVRQIITPGQELAGRLVEIARECQLTRAGFEAAHLSVADFSRLTSALGDDLELLPTEGLVEGLRQIKDQTELAIMRRAIALTDQVIEAVAARLLPEHTERQAAWMIEQALREGGAEGPAFPIIVAAGPNAAQPHHKPSDEPLGANRSIIIDMGARIDGYNADLTRTLVLGKPDERFWKIYNTVLEAQQRAIAGLRPGLLAHEGDALARDFIASAGYGENFGHGLGHCIGLDVHEGPMLRWTAPGGTSASLQSGMITSVEPGIYIEGWGGVRIEDLVLITPSGSEVLSAAPKIRQSAA
jgi:Xaa-Pro aminopeptidase